MPLTNVYKCYADEDPEIKGYYAVCYCCEINEGSFMSVDWYDGTKFVDWPVCYFTGPFDDFESALDFSRKNDISW